MAVGRDSYPYPLSIIQALLIYDMIISGDPMSATGHCGMACVDAPDEETLENGKKPGEPVAQIALKVRG
ncbi:MAG: hypothetical protein ABIJ31_09660 [Pseudomonadota bacterium]